MINILYNKSEEKDTGDYLITKTAMVGHLELDPLSDYIVMMVTHVKGQGVKEIGCNTKTTPHLATALDTAEKWLKC